MILMRIVRALITPFLSLIVLFVAGNLIIENIAEDRVAANVRRSFGLPSTPSVEISGFPILVRLAGRQVPSVVVTGRDVPVEGLHLRLLRVRLTEVAAGFDVFTSSDTGVEVGRAEAVGEVDEESANQFLRRRRIRARVRLRAEGVVVTGSFTVRDTRHRVTARGDLSVRGGVLSFTPRSVAVDGRRPPPSMAERARREATFRVRLPALPGDFRVTALEVRDEVAVLRATTSDYVLNLRP